jgi:hypothetical protein
VSLQKSNGKSADMGTFSMANLGSKKTGLPMVVWVSLKNAPHGPRLNVSQQYGNATAIGKWFVMTIEENSRVIGDTGSIRLMDVCRVENFIRKNRSLLRKYWDQEEYMNTSDLIEGLKKLDDW